MNKILNGNYYASESHGQQLQMHPINNNQCASLNYNHLISNSRDFDNIQDFEMQQPYVDKNNELYLNQFQNDLLIQDYNHRPKLQPYFPYNQISESETSVLQEKLIPRSRSKNLDQSQNIPRYNINTIFIILQYFQ